MLQHLLRTKCTIRRVGHLFAKQIAREMFGTDATSLKRTCNAVLVPTEGLRGPQRASTTCCEVWCSPRHSLRIDHQLTNFNMQSLWGFFHIFVQLSGEHAKSGLLNAAQGLSKGLPFLNRNKIHVELPMPSLPTPFASAQQDKPTRIHP